MPTFRYQVRIPDGRIQSGIVEAEDNDSAIEALEERQYEVLSIEPYAGISKGADSFLRFLNKVKNKELVATIRMLAVMVSASVPIVDSVRNIVHQTKNPRLKEIMADIANEIEGGAKLSDAMERYPNIFSGFFTNMIRSGETTGQLSEVLNYLADQQEKDFDIKSKLRGALMYPAFIIAGMFVAGFVMMVYVVPKLTQVIIEAGAELPLSTRILIGFSSILVNFWWVLILGAIIIGIFMWAWLKTEEGRYNFDKIKLNIPIFGGLLRDIYIVRFCQSMYTLMKGGQTLVQGLEVAASVIGNEVWKRMIMDTIIAVNDGESIVSVMQNSRYVPQMAVQMMAVGEDTGQLTDILKRISDFYSRSVDNASATILTLIEPIVIVTLGLGVGLMVSAIMIPLYNISGGV
ncbi:MAG: type II secretion system F family protein [Patescibacteria group bacterium]|nr:type II secretion system F family protein [Patescibacteria group bacterium]